MPPSKEHPCYLRHEEFGDRTSLLSRLCGTAAVREKNTMHKISVFKLEDKVMRSTAGESTARNNLSASFAPLFNVSSFIINCYLLQMLKLVKRLICCTETAALIPSS